MVYHGFISFEMIVYIVSGQSMFIVLRQPTNKTVLLVLSLIENFVMIQIGCQPLFSLYLYNMLDCIDILSCESISD